MGMVRSVGSRTEPLSSNQLRMWLYCQVLSTTPSFHGPVTVRLKGQLCMAALRAAVDRLALRHEILRTRFPVEGHIPVQLIEERVLVPVSFVDLVQVAPSTRDTMITKVIDQVSSRGFGLVSAPAWRVVIVRLAPTDHVLALTAHHMIVDLWSIGLMIDELCDLYRTSSAGLPSGLPAVPQQQAALASRQRDLPPQRASARQRWWSRYLAGVRVVQLAPAHISSGTPRLTTHVFQTELDSQLSDDIRVLCQTLGGTVYATVFGALATLIFRWCGQTEFAVVSNTSGRIGRDAERVVGTPVEYLIVRVDVGGDPTYRDLVGRIGNAALAAFDHLLPLDDMLEAIDPGRTSWPSPLRQLGFSVLNAPRATPALPGIDLSPLAQPGPRAETGICEGQLWVEIFDTGSGPLGIRWQFGDDLFERSSAQEAVEALAELLACVARRPDTRVSELAVSYRPEPAFSDTVTEPARPDGAMIESVRGIVEQVLGVTPTPGDNFFLLGGDTADAVALAGLLSARWGVQLSALDVELAPTVDGIAGAVARAGADRIMSKVDTAKTLGTSAEHADRSRSGANGYDEGTLP